MKENTTIKERKLNYKFIQIYTIIILVIAMAIFELGYCNCELLTNIIRNAGTDISYNFSLCRIFAYCVFIVLYIVFRKSFVSTAVEVSKNKYKRVFTYIACALAILITIVALAICIIKPEVFRGISIGIITVLMGSLFIIYISNNAIKNVIVALATFGIVFCIGTDFNHALDEKKHFMTAFNVAFLNFDYAENPITDKQIEALPQLSKFTTIDTFLREKYTPQITNEVNMEDVPSTPATYPAILYMPSALGIAIATFVGGSIIDIYIFGRIFNLITYGILICTALKILPFKKNIFTVVFLMPMLLMLGATYSIDGICVGVVSIFIAYCLKIYKESDTISLKQFLILVGLLLTVLLAKSMAYVLVCLIAFILPLINTLKKNKKYIPMMIAIAIVLLIAGIIVALHILKTKVGSDPRGTGHIDSGEQINFMINNPLACVKLAINHIKNTLLNFNWLAMLHQNVFFTNSSACVMLPMLLFILYVALTEDDKNFKIKEKIIFVIAFMAVFATTSLPLYLAFTQVGAMHIDGYQTRYILPVLPLLLMCISNNKIKTLTSQNRTMNVAIGSGIFLVIGLAQLILS